jgi:hypothetical protein
MPAVLICTQADESIPIVWTEEGSKLTFLPSRYLMQERRLHVHKRRRELVQSGKSHDGEGGGCMREGRQRRSNRKMMIYSVFSSYHDGEIYILFKFPIKANLYYHIPKARDMPGHFYL